MLTATLEDWNGLAEDEAAAAILPCNGSAAWACEVARQRPFAGEAELMMASDAVWLGLPEAEWQAAFATHPRIGERHAEAASAQSLSWSGKEQAAAMTGPEDEAEELARWNVAYEKRFGRVFLICASGRSKAEILSALKQRILRSAEEELGEAVEQQRQITRLRLGRWLHGE